jgi:hypothetical protein
MVDRIRRTDLALERADIQVTFDGLSVKPRLDLETLGDPQGYGPGDTVGFQSATNYPAFLTRGEVRIIDREARGGPRTVAVVPAREYLSEAQRALWAGVVSLVMVTCVVWEQATQRQSTDVRYFLSSLPPVARRLAA